VPYVSETATTVLLSIVTNLYGYNNLNGQTYNNDMPKKQTITEEVTTTNDVGDEEQPQDDASEDCGETGEDDSVSEAIGEWITIPRTLFHPENKITPTEARDYNYSCKLGYKLNEKGKEAELMARIERYRDKIEGRLKSYIEKEITKECQQRNIRYQGQPIIKLSQVADAWAEDVKLMSELWQCCFGSFWRQLDWENSLEEQVMAKMRFKYLDDEKFQKEGTDRRGNKGCVAKLATSAKRDIVKRINRKARKTHGKFLVAGQQPEYTVGKDGKKKYKKRKNNCDFTFDKERHVIDLTETVCILKKTALLLTFTSFIF
jgi:hypothetical protein